MISRTQKKRIFAGLFLLLCASAPSVSLGAGLSVGGYTTVAEKTKEVIVDTLRDTTVHTIGGALAYGRVAEKIHNGIILSLRDVVRYTADGAEAYERFVWNVTDTALASIDDTVSLTRNGASGYAVLSEKTQRAILTALSGFGARYNGLVFGIGESAEAGAAGVGDAVLAAAIQYGELADGAYSVLQNLSFGTVDTTRKGVSQMGYTAQRMLSPKYELADRMWVQRAASADGAASLIEKTRLVLRKWLGIGDEESVVIDEKGGAQIATTTIIERVIVEQTPGVTYVRSSESGVSYTDLALSIEALRADLEDDIDLAMDSPRQSDRGDSDELSIEDGPEGYLLSSTGNDIAWVATSSLGISGGGAADGSFSTTSADYWKTENNFYSTTSADYWLTLQSLGGFSTTSADYWQSVRNFFSTTSNDYWKSVNNFYSTTSADYWKSVNNFFSTTSADYLFTQRNFFSTTSANAFINASSTIANASGVTSGNVLQWNGTKWVSVATTTLGLGDVVGPSSATDNAIARFDLTTGKLVQNSVVTIADTTGLMSFPTNSGITSSGNLLISSGVGSVTSISSGGQTPTSGINFSVGAVGDTFRLTDGGVLLRGDFQYLFRSGTSFSSGSTDTGLARQSAGILRVTDGSSGGGALWANYYNATSTDATSTFSGGLKVANILYDANSFGGASGQVLSSTGTGVDWIDIAGDGAFSTTSADYWKSVNNFFSTTSADYLFTQRNFFSTTSANAFINASSTIASAGNAAWGDVMYWNGSRWTAIATTSLGISGGAGDTWVDAGSYVYPAESDYVEVPYINATSTTATSTFTNLEMLSTATLNGQTIEYWDEVPLDDPYKLKDWFDGVQGAGRTKGGLISANLDGTVDIDAGEGIVHVEEAGPQDNPLSCATCGQISDIEHTSWATTTSLALTDNAYNYIYYDYETGTIKATTDFYSISFTREFTLGRAYRRGNDVIVRLCGTNIWNFNRRVQLFGEEVFPIMRASGMTIAEVGTRGFSVTGGVLWAELVNRFTTDAFTTASDTFSAWHRDGVGGWTETTGQTQLSNTLYDDGDGTLGTISNNRYAVHFIYVVHDSTVHSVYGQTQNYTLAQAEAAQPPASIPGLLGAYGTLIGKVIIQKNDANFTEIQSAFTTRFTGSGTVVHNDTSGLQGGAATEYYHLTSAEYTGTGTGVFVRQTNPILLGNVGVGTTSPYAKLSVHANNGETNTTLFSIASSTASATTTLFVVRNDGNVGIASTSPNSLLTVSGTSSLRTILPEANLTYNLGSSTKRWNEAWVGTLNIGTSTWSINNGSDGRLSFFDAANGGGTERLSLLTNGNVGIGSTSPSTPFVVVGTSTFAGQLVTSMIPLGTDVSQGILYVNPPSLSSGGLVSWSANTGWNMGDLGFASGIAFVDIDNDGDYDLYSGQNGGTTNAYENTGTVSSPIWSANATWNIGDVGNNAKTDFADLDNDGDYDALVGESNGVVLGYENTGSASSPSWAAKVAWNSADVGDTVNPALADLDNDGDFDLLIGIGTGGVLCYTNSGSVSSPTWSATPSCNAFDIGSIAAPELKDFDGDGDFDLVVGSSAGTGFAYENTGTVSAPTWTAKSEWNVPDVGTNTDPGFADFDNDGDLDAIIGVDNGSTFGYENTGSIGSAGNTLFGVAVGGSERFRISGTSITASGYLTLNNYLNLTYSGTQAAATIQQNGSGDLLNVFDGSTEAFTILDGGNVGVGSSTPRAKLVVRGSAGVANIFEIASSTDANVLTVTGIGNVGIGTPSPSYKFDVAGFINVDQYSGFKQAGITILYASSTNSSVLVGKDAGRLLVAAGGGNTALGYEALYTATSSSDNTAIGNGALRVSVSSGGRNTAVGATSLYLNTYGYENTAVGFQSSALNTTGLQNTSFGAFSLGQNDDGSNNIAIGSYALSDGTSPDQNVAIGSNTLKGVTTGIGNIGLGYSAGWDTSVVNQRSSVDNYMTFVGYGASRDVSVDISTALSKSVAIGYNARVATSSAIVLGGTGADAVNVGIGTTSPWRTLSVVGTVGFSSSLASESGSDNYLCIDPTTYEVTIGGADCGASSLRFKTDIQDLSYGLADVMRLRPVTYSYKEDINPDTRRRLGLIAEEVYDVIPEVVWLDADGEPESVAYDNLVSLLIKAVQELSDKVDVLLAAVVEATDGLVVRVKQLLVDEEICIGETCVNEEQLKTLLENADITPTPPAEEPPIEEPPTEEPPVEEPSAEEPPVEEPPVDETPAEEPPIVEEPPVEEPSAEEPPAEESAPEEPPSETVIP